MSRKRRRKPGCGRSEQKRERMELKFGGRGFRAELSVDFAPLSLLRRHQRFNSEHLVFDKHHDVVRACDGILSAEVR